MLLRPLAKGLAVDNRSPDTAAAAAAAAADKARADLLQSTCVDERGA
jgi:hypothetical protein